MSEKRPETDADIVTRSQVLWADTLARAPRLKRRRDYSVDLPSHMAECDANYARLCKLFPDLRDQASLKIALPLPGFHAEVHFEVLEKGPYTTLLKVAARTEGKWMAMAAAPEMTVRAYHDAQSAEVVSYQNQNRFHGKYDYPNHRMRQRDEKVQINRFLGEFLTLCLAHGASTHPISF